MQLWWRCAAFQGLATRTDVDPDARLFDVVGRASRLFLYTICPAKSM